MHVCVCPYMQVTKRTGWVRCNVYQPESIAGVQLCLVPLSSQQWEACLHGVYLLRNAYLVRLLVTA